MFLIYKYHTLRFYWVSDITALMQADDHDHGGTGGTL